MVRTTTAIVGGQHVSIVSCKLADGSQSPVVITRPDAARLRDWLTAWLGEG